MSSLLIFSDDILLHISFFLTALDLYNIRLTNRRLASLILNYEKSLAPFVEENTLLSLNLPLDWKSNASNLKDLGPLIPQYISAVVVDRAHDSSSCRLRSQSDDFGFAPDDPAGDKARNAIIDGLWTWKQFSDISKQSFNEASQQVHKHFWQSQDAFNKTLLARAEELTYETRLSYLHSWAHRQGMEYNRLRTFEAAGNLLMALFMVSQYIRTTYAQSCACMLYCTGHVHISQRDADTPMYFDRYQEPKEWRVDDPLRRIDSSGLCSNVRYGSSWVMAFLMKEGPYMFFDQWSGRKPGDYVKRVLLRAWEERSEAQVAIEREFGSTILRAAEELAMRVQIRGRRRFWVDHECWSIEGRIREMFRRESGKDGSSGLWSAEYMMGLFVFLCC